MVRLFVTLSISWFLLSCGGGGGPEKKDVGDISADGEGTTGDVLEITELDTVSFGDDAVVSDRLDRGEDIGIPETCYRDQDCANFPVGDCQRPKCNQQTKRCEAQWISDCPLEAVFFEEDFENGELPQGFVVDDPKQDDFVTWFVTDHKKAFGKYSLYFGSARCHTYYNGALDSQCHECFDPGDAQCIGDVKGATIVRASVTTPAFFVPPTGGTKVVSFYVYLDSEPLIDGIPEDQQPDQFRVTAITSDDPNQPKVLFNSVSIGKTTNGEFIFVAASLKGFEGKEVRIRFTFDTLDQNNNHFEGVYIDRIKAFSLAKPTTCEEGSSCPADNDVCTDDSCIVYSNLAPYGYCAYPAIPTCVQPECTDENVSQVCTAAKECEQAKCVQGKCVYEEVPGCCKTVTLFSASFDDGSLQGFNIFSYKNEAKVKWQLSRARSTSPEYSLYYGDVIALGYDTPGETNFGEATTNRPIIVPAGGNVFLTFYLFLSTEFDLVDPANYNNPLNSDFLQVFVVEYIGSPPVEKATEVFNSHKVRGTTDYSFWPIGVDLTDFAGKTIYLRFRFGTWDDVNNRYIPGVCCEGVYIDDIRVTWTTQGTDCPPRKNCIGDYDCGVDYSCWNSTCNEDACIKGHCVNNVCHVEPPTAPGCCDTSADCDDGDICTIDDCVDHVCYHVFVEGPGCCEERVITSWDFDDGSLSNFSVADDGTSVKWQQTEQIVHSSPYALYFGNGTNYDNGTVAQGSALSPVVTLPPTGKYSLGFFVYLDIDPDPIFDKFTVEVVEQQSGSQTKVFDKSGVPEDLYKTWFQVPGIDLSSFKGKQIKVRFSFNSVDQINNSGFGIVVDDVIIKKVCQ